MSDLSRRGLFGAVGVGGAAAGALVLATAGSRQEDAEPEASDAYPYHGPHQAGIVTPRPANGILVAMTVWNITLASSGRLAM